VTSPGADEGGVPSPLYSVDVGSRSDFGVLVQRVPGGRTVFDTVGLPLVFKDQCVGSGSWWED
jgi:hypothetical protein